MTEAVAAGRRIQSIERAAAVLRLLARGSRRVGVVELAASLALPKGTVHGILRTLTHLGFVEQDLASGKYQLGGALLHLGASYLDASELRSRGSVWADALSASTGAAVRIGRLLDGRVLVVHHVVLSDDPLQITDVGSLLPPHACAIGKVLLAYDSTAAAVAARRLEPCTPRTLATASEFFPGLAEIRERGWASELEEMNLGVAGVAARIRAHEGLVVGSIGIDGDMERLCDADGSPVRSLVCQVQDAARSVSRELGHRW